MLWAWQQLAHEMAVVREEHHRRQLALREAYVVAEKRYVSPPDWVEAV
jgi:hypothetical protein